VCGLRSIKGKESLPNVGFKRAVQITLGCASGVVGCYVFYSGCHEFGTNEKILPILEDYSQNIPTLIRRFSSTVDEIPELVKICGGAAIIYFSKGIIQGALKPR